MSNWMKDLDAAMAKLDGNLNQLKETMTECRESVFGNTKTADLPDVVKTEPVQISIEGPNPLREGEILQYNFAVSMMTDKPGIMWSESFEARLMRIDSLSKDDDGDYQVVGRIWRDFGPVPENIRQSLVIRLRQGVEKIKFV